MATSFRTLLDLQRFALSATALRDLLAEDPPVEPKAEGHRIASVQRYHVLTAWRHHQVDA